jgi:glycosyltransferase involved in cell wall biosynthesis
METAPWGGSEELWSEAALLLRKDGFAVEAYVRRWSPLPSPVLRLIKADIDVQLRPQQYPLWRRGWQKTTRPREMIFATEIENFLCPKPPDLIVINEGGSFPPPDLIDVCVKHNWPFVTLCHANSEQWWPHDDIAERYRETLLHARGCYFVSEANRMLAEKQIGCQLRNTAIVRNPFGVPFNHSPPWTPLGRGNEIRFACVGRIDPSAKGQDLLLEVLAKPIWRGRKWSLTFYGNGKCQQVLERMVQSFNLTEHVKFAGHVPVHEIWKTDHVLVMPSRYEGLPIAVVEAMLSARPVVATDVGGNAEVIEDSVTGFVAESPTTASLARALERCWAERTALEQMGLAGARRIRRLVPPDPVSDFANKLFELVRTPNERQRGACPPSLQNKFKTPRRRVIVRDERV